MKLLNSRKRARALLAGVLAAAVLSLPLTGCNSSQLVSDLSSIAPLSSIYSALKASSDVSAKSSASAAAASAASSKKAVVSKASSAVAVKSASQVQTQKKPAPAPESGNQSIQKIPVDQTATTVARAAVPKITVTTAKYSKIDQRYGYGYLSDSNSRGLYNQMLQSVYTVAVKASSSGYYPMQPIVINAHLTESQLRIALMAFFNDNPQVFWTANVYSYAYTSGSTHIQLYSTVPQDQCTAMIQQLNQKVSSIISTMPSGLSELDREIYLSDYLVQHCSYDTAAVTDNTRWKAFNSYGALIEGKVVCEGYARAMQLLSSYSGLGCMLLTGEGNSQSHMWNLMKIDGSWYHLDITWNDNSLPVYTYFNITDAVIQKSHTIYPTATSLTAAQLTGANGTPVGFNLVVPACTATKANYYFAKGIRFDGDTGSGSETVAKIVEAAKQKTPSLSFYVMDSIEYNKGVSLLIGSALSRANGQLPEGSRIYSIQYMPDPDNRGITVYYKYR